MDRSPTLTEVATLRGAVEDQPFAVTWPALSDAADEAASGGRQVSFRLVQVTSGTLTKGGGAVVEGETLLGPDEIWVWTPAPNANGTLGAFTVRAFDGEQASDEAVPVTIEVVPVPDPPTFSTVSPFDAKLGRPLTITYEMLAASADAADPDGDVLTFELAQLQAGTLTQAGEPAVAGTTVLGPGSEPWMWTAGSLGDHAAFTVSVSDGVEHSTPVQVTMHVTLARLTAEWLGGSGVGSPWTRTGISSWGSRDGMMWGPQDIAVAGEYIYVADHHNRRVLRFDRTDGTFAGWVGSVLEQPTGGAEGCTSAALYDITPGWCLGGRSGAGVDFPSAEHLAVVGSALLVSDTGDPEILQIDLATGAPQGWITGVAFAGGLVSDGTYLYASEFLDNRLVRIDLATGVQEWTGRVGDVVPDSCVSGTLPAAHSPTGSWCTGGTAESGRGEGELQLPGLLYLDGDDLYVASTTLQRFSVITGAPSPLPTSMWAPAGVAIAGGNLYLGRSNSIEMRNLDTGALEGWIGRTDANHPPSSCLSGLPSPGYAQVTGSWCTGGTPYSGLAQDSTNGALVDVQAMVVAGDALFVTDFALDRVQELDLATGAPRHWLGASVTPLGGWSTRDDQVPLAARADGVFESPEGIAVDAATDAFFVASMARISKHATSSGAFLGWTGWTELPPSSCEDAMPSSFPGPTGGWCTGGGVTYTIYANGGIGDAAALALDEDYIYAFDESRINRFTRDGAFAGWIGKIEDTTGISPAACAAAAVGDFTPDWCFGGDSSSDDRTFFFTWSLDIPRGVAVTGNTMLIVDNKLHRVAKIDITPGNVRFLGWTGQVGDPTGILCEGGQTPAAGEATGAWCTGGTSEQGTGDGAFYSPTSLALDAAGNIYVVDSRRLSKLRPDGSFAGWVGGISGTITDGPCAGAAGVTPGWCTGGSASGLVATGSGVYYDLATDLVYVANSWGSRIDKVDALSGAYLGWAGEVSTRPTGGGVGCTTAVTGELTPSWCLGGSARVTDSNGSFSPSNITGDADYLYITDPDHNRVVRLSKAEQ